MKQMRFVVDGTLENRREHEARLANASPDSIAIDAPELLQIWDWEKNSELGLDPYRINRHSKKTAWWVCPTHGKAHSHPAIIRNKAKRPWQCSVCNGRKVVTGVNDLQSNSPELMEEWDWDKNDGIGLDPSKVTCKSSKKAWWVCKEYKHSWPAVIQSRFNGTGCPYCAGTKVLSGFNDLATTNPQLLPEWDYNKNTVDPTQVMRGSRLKASWVCSKCGNHFEMAISDRAIRGSICPICARKNRAYSRATPKPGHSFADEFPSIAAEWHPTKNGNKSPADFTPHSNQSVWWLCEYGHEWKATINNRTGVYKRGCPTCAGYTNTSFPEKAIFYYVMQVFKDAVSNTYVELDDGQTISLDIWIPSIKTAIEYDGQRWHRDAARNANKDFACFENGIKLIRVSEPECAVYNDIVSTIRIVRNGHQDHRSLDEVIRATLRELCVELDMDVNTARDEVAIREMIVAARVKNSFGENCPEFASEWHPTKNGNLTPFMFSHHSQAKAWFKCKTCGKSYQMTICDKSYGKGCYTCSMKELGKKKMIPHEGESFGDIYPEVAKAWDQEKNGDVTPFDVKPQSNKRFHWKCTKCGYSWMTSVQHMVKKGNSLCKKCNQSAFGKRRRKTPEQFAEEVKQNVENVELIGKYTREADKIECRCTACGNTWFAWPGNLIRGHGCNECAKTKRSETKRQQAAQKRSPAA